ncbi:MAG TPA: HisA/HisF-related TIM barrel protein [Methylophilaceae bacterium]|nr:HisA/HisF-related TIM barrel protein [Methylophilaceae bacterium]
MEIIPVIDLLGGQIVRAQQGERGSYQPIRSLLCDSTSPKDIAQALLGLYPFKSLYIADLDAIQGLGSNLDKVSTLRQHFPHIKLWLDAGVTYHRQLVAVQDMGLTCIIGSERLETLAQLQQLHARDSDAVLSLDFGRQGFMGPPELLENTTLWPQRLICMTLEKVGSYEGMDMEKLSCLQKLAGRRRVYAAGGVRDAVDLQRLSDIGISGVLVASALHDGKITSQQISSFMT